MNYCFELNEYYKKPLLYINYRRIKNLTTEKKKNVFKKELIYLFFEENALTSFYNEKSYQTIIVDKLLQFIYDFVNHLLEIYKNTYNKQILAVIDNFDEEDENEIKILQNLIDLIKKEENWQKIRLIISGRCKFIFKKQLLYLKNQLNIKRPVDREMLLCYNIKLKELNEMMKLIVNPNLMKLIIKLI